MHCWPASRYPWKRPASSAARPNGRKSRPTPEYRWPCGTQSRSRSNPIDLAGVAKLAKNDTKKLLLVNLWATWCGPCVAELPELVTMNRMYRGRNFQFVTISLDELAKRRGFAVLKENHVAASNFILSRTIATSSPRHRPGMARPCALHPFDPASCLRVRYLAEAAAVDPLEVKRAIVSYLGRSDLSCYSPALSLAYRDSQAAASGPGPSSD